MADAIDFPDGAFAVPLAMDIELGVDSELAFEED